MKKGREMYCLQKEFEKGEQEEQEVTEKSPTVKVVLVMKTQTEIETTLAASAVVKGEP
jgi:hypothetical protein